MTIEELYEWAKENGVENFEIYLEERVYGGTYQIEPYINEALKEVSL